jgi:hypothetical protein
MPLLHLTCSRTWLLAAEHMRDFHSGHIIYASNSTFPRMQAFDDEANQLGILVRGIPWSLILQLELYIRNIRLHLS